MIVLQLFVMKLCLMFILLMVFVLTGWAKKSTGVMEDTT